MNSINHIINSIFDLFFSPFSSIDPIYGLCAISFLTTLIMLPIFKYTSDQEAIRRTKGRIMGHLLEVRLFKDDIRTVLSAQKNMLKYNMIYLKHMLKPLIFVMLPVAVILIQTGLRYEYRPLVPGETAIVKVSLSNPDKLAGNGGSGVLVSPAGLKIETPPLRINGGKEIYWRIRAEKKGEYDLKFRMLDKEINKRVVVGEKLRRISSKVLKGGLLNSFIYPGEPSLTGDSGVEYFEVIYPYGSVALFGWKTHWLVLFFILSLSFGFLLLKPFRVSV